MFGLSWLSPKLWVAVIGVALLGAVLLWGQQGHQQAREARLNAELIATQRDGLATALEGLNRAAIRAQEATIDRIARADKLAADRAVRIKGLEDALKSNPEWSATAVPDSVWDALFPDSPKRQDAPRPPAAPAPTGVPGAGTPDRPKQR